MASQWHEAPEGKRDLIESFDALSGVRNALRLLAHDRREWAGYPMPMEGHRLVVEPTYPRAEALMSAFTAKQKAEDDERKEESETYKIRSTFWSWKHRCDVWVWEKDGKIEWAPMDLFNQLGRLLDTLGASDAWGIEQESNAINTLGGLVKHRQFKQYMLTGMFLETSRRSGVVYMFRRLRPTIAMTMRGESPRVLAALCLHPIAYYANSWAGAMCPTDDVIAHLSLMRGDEAMFWKRANQHAPHRKEAGLI